MGIFDNLFDAPDAKQKTKIDPRVRQYGYDTLSAADYLTSRPYETYGGPRVAPFGADTLGGMETVRSNAGRWVPFVNEAAGGARAGGAPIAMGDFTPERVTADQVTAGQLAGMNLDPYMNPGQSAVADTTMARIMQARNAQQADLRRRQAGSAYGGSAGAVQAAQLDESVNRQVAETMSQLMAQGYTQAQAAAMADMQRKMQADLANQGANLQAGTFNANMGAQAYGMNLGRLQADRAAASQGAELLARLGLQGQQMGYEDAARQLAIGEMEQAQRQRSMDTAYQDWLRQQQHPFEMINFRNAALQGIPYNQTTTTQGGGGSPLAQLAGIGITGAGIWNNWFRPAA